LIVCNLKHCLCNTNGNEYNNLQTCYISILKYNLALCYSWCNHSHIGTFWTDPEVLTNMYIWSWINLHKQHMQVTW